MPDFVVSKVIAVQQDEGLPPKIIPHQFELRVQLSQQKLVLFCLVASFAPDSSSASNPSIYLRFTGDSLHPLHRAVYNKINPNPYDPSYLNHIWDLLQDTKIVTCLQFQLRDGKLIQLAVPLDFYPEKIPNNTTRSAFQSAEALAGASSFSLYFRADALRKRSLREYNAAIRRTLEKSSKAYEDMLDVRRLYNGIGGKVHRVYISRGHRDGSPLTRESCSSPASAATTASCGSTLPFDTVPRPPESPPSYEEYLNEGQSPRIGPDAAATSISIKNLPDSLAPPEYGYTEQWRNVLDPKGVLPSGSQDVDEHPTTKRKRSITGACPTGIVVTGASQPKKLSRSGSADPDNQSNVRLLLQLQRQQIEELQKHVKSLQAQVNKLEKRHDDLEGDCCMLQERQDATDDDVNNLQVDVDELGNTCGDLRVSMLDVYDEFNDLKETMTGTPEGDQCKSCENMAKEIGEHIRAEADEIKKKICQALQ
ncbi:hypothetical protein LX36DRAFT_656739 [Colletotrichum falcatum]|nr:hypothetical protein LX36DRAFT_656739 [Colletotrichum falcatum]